LTGDDSPPVGRKELMHYLIVRRGPMGLEASRAPDEGWYARGFSGGELISLLFALHESVAWVMSSPLPGHLLIEDALSRLISRDDFIASLLVT
jgi:hypothetical protein